MPEPEGTPPPGAAASLPAPPGSAGANRSGAGAGDAGGRTGILQGVLFTVLAVLVFGGLVWFLDQPGSTPTSQAVALTAKASGPAPKIGQPAPAFRLLGLDGQPVELESFRGQPVWITFWASWCPPCRAEAPDIEAAYLRHQDAGLVVLAIDVGEGPGTVAGYVERTRLSFTIALDESTEVAATYRLAGLPTHFFVDGDGILRDWKIGSMSPKEMERRLESILPTTPGE